MTGTFKFCWNKPASEVYVTGTFDGWSRREKLERVGDVFEKEVELPIEKTLYKFVVDENWVIDPNSPIETDASGIQNNLLLPEQIQPPQLDMSQAAINSVAPQSTTAELAGAVPKEQSNGTANGAVSTPGAGAVPGGFPETPATEREQAFSVNPLPASDTAENPINLKPGEPVPKQVGTQSLESNVHLDKESYEKGASNFPVNQLLLPEVVTPAAKREAEGRGILDLPKNLIPESGLPITSASEAQAAKQPEHHAEVPEIVKESQEKAHFAPEASGVPEKVEEKAEVEHELKEKVPEKPPVAEGNTVVDKATAAMTSAFTSVTNAFSTSASKVPEPTSALSSVTAAVGLGSKAPEQPTEPVEQVPNIVKESLAEAGAPAEAAAVQESVEHKKEVEAELKSEVETKKSIPQENADKTHDQKEPVVTNGIQSATTSAHDEGRKPKESVVLNGTTKPHSEGLKPTEEPETKSNYDDAVEEHPAPANGKTAEPVKPVENGTKPADAHNNGESAPKKSLESTASKGSKSSSKKGRRRSIFGRFLGKLFH